MTRATITSRDVRAAYRDDPEVVAQLKAKKQAKRRQSASPAAITVTVPMQVMSEANARCYFHDRARRVKRQRSNVSLVLHGCLLPCLPVTVQMVRLIPKRGRAYDCDNLASALKATRDQIAAEYGLPDNDPGFAWYPAQLPSPNGLPGVRIEIVSLQPASAPHDNPGGRP